MENNGKCSECRKRNYYKKQCTANKRMLDNLANEVIAKTPIVHALSSVVHTYGGVPDIYVGKSN